MTRRHLHERLARLWQQLPGAPKPSVRPPTVLGQAHDLMAIGDASVVQFEASVVQAACQAAVASVRDGLASADVPDVRTYLDHPSPGGRQEPKHPTAPPT